MATQETDVIIIGAGPVGLFAIFECGMLGLKCHVIDSLSEIGGQCTALYPEKPIYDIPGMPAILAGDLIDSLEKQAAPFKPAYHLEQSVTSLDKHEDETFTIATSKATKIKGKAIIIAAGGGAFGPNKPPLANIADFENTSVFYACRNKEQFRGKRLVIAGGGDSALDWAIALSDIAEKVSLVHRRDKFRASPDSVEKLHKLASDGKIDLLTPFQLKELKGFGAQLSHVSIGDLDGNVSEIEADSLLCFYGLASSLGVIEEWGLNIKSKHILVNQATSQLVMLRHMIKK